MYDLSKNDTLNKISTLPFTQSVVALLMIIPGDIESLIEFFSFTSWIFYGTAMLALIVMRFTKRDAPRPYKV